MTRWLLAEWHWAWIAGSIWVPGFLLLAAVLFTRRHPGSDPGPGPWDPGSWPGDPGDLRLAA